jgi:hypothetical protein
MGTPSSGGRASKATRAVHEDDHSGQVTESENNASATEVAVTFLQAWTSGDHATARGLCHADLCFQGPMETRSSADEHLSALATVAGTVTSLNIVRTVAQGTDVVLFYDLMMTAPVGTVTIAELNVVKSGRLTEIRANFDTDSFRGESPSSR